MIDVLSQDHIHNSKRDFLQVNSCHEYFYGLDMLDMAKVYYYYCYYSAMV